MESHTIKKKHTVTLDPKILIKINSNEINQSLFTGKLITDVVSATKSMEVTGPPLT